MIVLDTNVVSELFGAEPDPRVEAWLAAQNGPEVFLTSVTEAELRYGVEVLPSGRRRTALAKVVEDMLLDDFAGRILPFDSLAASAYARIAAGRRAAGRPISQFDCQIAAIVQVHGAAVATRNANDFSGCGIEVIDPWNVG